MAKKSFSLVLNLTAAASDVSAARSEVRIFSEEEIAHLSEAEFLYLVKVSATNFLRQAKVAFGTEALRG